MPPSRAAIVLSSRRSIGPPEVLSMSIVVSARKLRVAKLSRRPTVYVAVRLMLVRLTEPGTMPVAVTVAAGAPLLLGAGGVVAAAGSAGGRGGGGAAPGRAGGPGGGAPAPPRPPPRVTAPPPPPTAAGGG